MRKDRRWGDEHVTSQGESVPGRGNTRCRSREQEGARRSEEGKTLWPLKWTEVGTVVREEAGEAMVKSGGVGPWVSPSILWLLR